MNFIWTLKKIFFSEMFCWARNTYWVSFDEDIPEDIGIREKRMVSYYQWTPFFFVICAFLFYAPCLIWRMMYDKSGEFIKNFGFHLHVLSFPTLIQS